jgi:shikimate kinase
MTLWVVGMMGTGKTTAGAMAANSLGVGFVDSDHEVEAESGLSVHDLWFTYGQDRFRELERQVIAQVGGLSSIVATGGGVVLNPDNRREMSQSGPVIWLQASPEVIASRLGERSRPLLDESSDVLVTIANLIQERQGLYAMVATHVIDTDNRDPRWVSEEIAARWND